MKKIFQRMIGTVTAVLTALTVIPYQAAFTAGADVQKTISGLGVSVIGKPGYDDLYWKGDLVYFGSYKGIPIKFRVLSKSSASEYGINEPTLLLDSDVIVDSASLFNQYSDSEYSVANIKAGDIWRVSPARKWLNETFPDTAFSDDEQKFIANSSRSYRTSMIGSQLVYSMPLSDDRIFITDYTFIKPSMGSKAASRDADVPAMTKAYIDKDISGINANYWISSVIFSAQYADMDSVSGRGSSTLQLWKNAGNKYAQIQILGSINIDTTRGICPALNLMTSDVLFSSKVNDGDAYGRNAYKLTFITDDISIDNAAASRSGNDISVSYEFSSGKSRANRISVLITDKKYTDSGSEILYYGEISNGKFTLPDEIGRMDMSDCHVYIIGEEANGERESDYASRPVEITLDQPEKTASAAVSLNAPTAGEAFPNASSSDADVKSTVWKKDGSEVSGNAGFNTAYTAEILLAPKAGFRFADNVSVSGISADKTVKNSDGTLTVTCSFPATRKAKLQSTAALSEVTLAHGIASDKIGSHLPKTIGVVTEDSAVDSAKVTWDTSSLSYDPNNADSEQRFTVNGTLDTSEIDPADVGASVSISVRVSGHTAGSSWTYNETEHYKNCTSPGCTAKLSSAAHSFVDSYDYRKWQTDGGSYTDYPIKKCEICGYSYSTSGSADTVASVAVPGSGDLRAFSNILIAWNYAKENQGSVLTLLNDAAFPNSCTQSANQLTLNTNNIITVDLNGHTLTLPNSGLGQNLDLNINGGSLTIRDSSGSGRIAAVSQNTFTLTSGSLTVDGGTLDGTITLIKNSSGSSADPKFTVNGGTVNSDVNLKGGDVSISGGVFSGKVTFGLSASVKLSGGSFAELGRLSPDLKGLLRDGFIYKYTSGDNAGRTTDGSGILSIQNVKAVLSSAHTCLPTLVPQVDADCTSSGIREHYECSCGKMFKDASGKVPTSAAELSIPASHTGGTADCLNRAVCTRCGKPYGSLSEQHSFGADNFGYSDDGHWKVCSVCGAHDTLQAHVMTAGSDCTNGKECSICGYSDGSGRTAHSWSAWSQDTSADSHTRSCTVRGCTASETEPCTGGTADCISPAKCTVCGGEHGAPDPNRHRSDKIKFSQTADKHMPVYVCCGASAGDEQYHDWNSSNVCNDCGYGCKHSFGTPQYTWSDDGSLCTAVRVCGSCNYFETENGRITYTKKQPQTCTDPEISDCMAVFRASYYSEQFKNDVLTKDALGHDFSSEWESSAAEHYHKCSRCDEVSGNAPHSGGTADCMRGALCSECGAEYGAKAPDVHVGTLGFVPVSDAMHRQEYSCCGMIVGAEEAHTLNADRICEKCGYGCDHSYPNISYVWSADNTTCLASAECIKCGDVKNRSVSAVIRITQAQSCVSPEITSYTANFTEAPFTRQTKSVQTKNALGHNSLPELVSDDSGHWNACENCAEKLNFGAHSFDNGTVLEEADEASEGKMIFVCTVCGFEKTEVISPTGHEHKIGDNYFCDETGHWQGCEGCGERIGFAPHISDNGVITKEPTAWEAGEKAYSCTVCGYLIRTESIPASGGTEIPVQPDYRPSYISMSEFLSFTGSAFTGSVFTEKLKAGYEADGNTLTISWDKIGDAEKYIVYQQKDGKYKPIKYTKDTSLTLKDLKNDCTYRFIVKYIKDGSISPVSCSSKLTVKIYYKPSVTAKADETSITLSWKPVPNAEKYAVYRYEDGRASKLWETEKTAVVLTGLKPGTMRKYIVRVYSGGKWSVMTMADIIEASTNTD